jgi:hypothetical protein
MVEIKTPAGELSDPQQSVMAAVLASGGRVGVVRNVDEMLGFFDAWAFRGQSAWRCVHSYWRVSAMRSGRSPTR